MSRNWRELEADLERAITEAAERTDDALASRASSLTHLTDEEIKELFPTPADLKKLNELMEIVEAAEKDNTQLVRLEDNIHQLAGTVVTLLGKLV